MKRAVTDLPPWECMMKKMVWQQLGAIAGRKILDFGSGVGVTADHLAEKNDVTAVEPDEDSVENRWMENPYTQLIGSTDILRQFAEETSRFRQSRWFRFTICEKFGGLIWR